MALVFTRGARSDSDSWASTKCGALPVSTFGFDRLLRNRRGNVAMMYALVAPILVFGGGAAIDYGRAAQIHTKLNAAADAAALAALTPAMLQQSSTVAQAAAVSMFNGLTEGIPGLTAHATQVTVTVTPGATTLIRNVAISYSSSVDTIFAQVLGKSALSVSGLSQASAQAPPNIDFLRPARQLAVDGSAGDAGRHHPDAEPDPQRNSDDRRRVWRMRLRLPSIQRE
jgi:Flp pilus assembly protein TadG